MFYPKAVNGHTVCRYDGGRSTNMEEPNTAVVRISSLSWNSYSSHTLFKLSTWIGVSSSFETWQYALSSYPKAVDGHTVCRSERECWNKSWGGQQRSGHIVFPETPSHDRLCLFGRTAWMHVTSSLKPVSMISFVIRNQSRDTPFVDLREKDWEGEPNTGEVANLFSSSQDHVHDPFSQYCRSTSNDVLSSFWNLFVWSGVLSESRQRTHRLWMWETMAGPKKRSPSKGVVISQFLESLRLLAMIDSPLFNNESHSLVLLENYSYDRLSFPKVGYGHRLSMYTLMNITCWGLERSSGASQKRETEKWRARNYCNRGIMTGDWWPLRRPILFDLDY